MPIEITMPRLSDTMEEGTLIKWRVKEGDKVKSGDLLADVETDKATMELQSFDEGTVAKLVAGEGQTLPVGGLILVLAEAGEDPKEVAAAVKPGGSGTSGDSGGSGGGKKAATKTPTAEAQEVESPDASEEEEQAEEAPAATAGGRVRVSPVARKLAEEMGVDLSGVKGSGPAGRIIKRDVLSAAERKSAGPAQPAAAAPKSVTIQTPATAGGKIEAKTIPLSSMRKTIARRLVESKSSIPHFTVTVTVDMDLLLGPRGAKKQLESQGIKLSVNDFVIRAAALSLLQHPLLNASWSDGGIVVHGTVNMGVAVSLPAERGGGLVVPVIRDAQNKGLRQINDEVRRLAEKARGQGLSAEEMQGGTFTISNLGMFGVEHFEAIINPPQSAILAVGAAIDTPVVREGQVVPGKQMTCTLSADHRVIDGAMAAEYLQTLRGMLENPAILLV